jgi:hypothetical protein
MDNFLYEIINKLIEELPNNLKDPTNPIVIDLVLDSGVFNGSYLTGALFFLKEMEKRNFIKIDRISGSSVGAISGFLYLIDKLELSYILYDNFVNCLKEKHNLKILKKIDKLLSSHIQPDVCNVINNRLFIKYNNVKTKTHKIKSVYKNKNDLINTLIRSSFFPFLIDGNIIYENKYVDGMNPYMFEKNVCGSNKKILFLDLTGTDKLFNIINIKNEPTNCYRIVYGLLDMHIFFAKNKNTSMCSYVNNWNCLNSIKFNIRIILEKIICYVIYCIVFINKHLCVYINNNINYKIIKKTIYYIFKLLLDNYCL